MLFGWSAVFIHLSIFLKRKDETSSHFLLNRNYNHANPLRMIIMRSLYIFKFMFISLYIHCMHVVGEGKKNFMNNDNNRQREINIARSEKREKKRKRILPLGSASQCERTEECNKNGGKQQHRLALSRENLFSLKKKLVVEEREESLSPVRKKRKKPVLFSCFFLWFGYSVE